MNTYQSIFLEASIAEKVVASIPRIRTYDQIIHALIFLALMAGVEREECGPLPIFSFWPPELSPRNLCHN